MAQMPIEVVDVGDLAAFDPGRALALANSLQSEFVYLRLPEKDALGLQSYAFKKMNTRVFLDRMNKFRNEITGFHPYLIAFVDSYLDDGKYENIFGSDQPEKGLAVFTTCGVADTIIPKERMLSYFLYYLAKATLCFLAPEKKNHRDTKKCVFDNKDNKRDIVQSMRARALCDSCRAKLLRRRKLLCSLDPISLSQLKAIDELFRASGDAFEGKQGSAPRAFIGSSTEGLGVAVQLQELLKGDLETVIWNQGTVFGLGDTTIESLEEAVLGDDYGIFVLRDDDKLESRGIYRDVPRDNVVFELGLFMGKLTRRRVFGVRAKGVSLPVDLAGLTTAIYDPAEPNLKIALSPVVQQIRSKLGALITDSVILIAQPLS